MNYFTKKNLNTLFITAISVLIIFRIPCTVLIMLYFVYSILVFKKDFTKQNIIAFFVLSIPFGLNVIFFWNNSDVSNSLRPIEKSLSFFIFPFALALSRNEVDFKAIFRFHALIFPILIAFLIMRFGILFPEKITHYLHGIEIWEMGYVIANSIGIHAPALNMILAFTCSIILHQLLYTKKYFLYGFLLILALLDILIINTRVAIAVTIFNLFLVAYVYWISQKSKISTAYILTSIATLIIALLVAFMVVFPYYKTKFVDQAFNKLNMVGKLDELDNPQASVHTSLVTRLSIWKTASELAMEKPVIGQGTYDAKVKLFRRYDETEQYFLLSEKFPVHNQWLDFFLRYGIVGFLSYAFLFVFLLMQYKKTTKELLFSLVILMFVSNLFDDFFMRFDGIVFFSLWSSLLIAKTKNWVSDNILLA